jgi:anaerobic ribonucleoside-triphosphate reductase activating protein
LIKVLAPLRVGGLVPLTTLDYPGQLACVLFCQGCAWRCRYCHNPALLCPRGEQEVPWVEVRAFLKRRQGLLDAVVFSGGEATLQPGLPAAMQEVRALGFKVGLHSAGIKPSAFKRVLPLSDWVGFDVKALEEETVLITGVSDSGRANWQSLELLLDSAVDYECRTTVHWQLTDCRRLQRLAERLAGMGVQHFVVQQARGGQMLDPALGASGCPVEVRELWTYLEQLFPRFTLRQA